MPNAPHSGTQASADVVAEITRWYGENARDLPWREPGASPWAVLVSEVMAQQTPLARVLPVWTTWMERWPTPSHLAAASQADAVRAWERLGYPRRAKALWECARYLVAHHGGEVPQTRAELLALPGVGDYTASAVLSFAFGQRAIVLDTNVRRVLARVWRGEPLPPVAIRRAERDLAEEVAPAEPAAAALWAVASMEFGALVCTARAPRCDECPLTDQCAWFRGGRLGLADAPVRTQAWHGTDRQVRGRIMAILRATDGPVVVTGRADLADVEPGQLDRCLESLTADALISQVDANRGLYALA